MWGFNDGEWLGGVVGILRVLGVIEFGWSIVFLNWVDV